MSELAVRALAHCPNPRRIPANDRWHGAYIAEVCDCPRDHPTHWRVHWMHQDGRPMHCPCGLRQRNHGPSDDYLITMNDGYVCADCLPRVPRTVHMQGRPLVSDLPCCYCLGTARAGSGYGIAGPYHPELLPPVRPDEG